MLLLLAGLATIHLARAAQPAPPATGSEPARLVQRTPATEHLFSPTDTTSTGVLIQTVMPSAGPGPQSVTTAESSAHWTWTGPIDIPDNNTSWDTGVNFSAPIALPGGSTVTSVSVHHVITHPYIGDLGCILYNATHTWTIRNQTGGGADNIDETLTDSTTFTGDDIAQNWYYRVRDLERGDTGTLDAVTLLIYYNAGSDLRPDLVPYQPSSWDDTLPVGIALFAYNVDHAYAGPYRDDQILYLNRALWNTGVSTAGSFNVVVEVTGDGGGTYTSSVSSLASTYWHYLTHDIAIGPLAAGTHTIKMWVDPDNDVDEVHEDNNYYERTITVISTTPHLRVDPNTVEIDASGTGTVAPASTPPSLASTPAPAVTSTIATAGPLPSLHGDNLGDQLQRIYAEKATRSADRDKLTADLRAMTDLAAGRPALLPSPAIAAAAAAADDSTTIELTGTISAALLTAISAGGGTVIDSQPAGSTLVARLPVAAIATLARRDDVRTISPWCPPITNKVNTSEGDVAHRTNLGRSTFSVSGADIKVGVISDSASATQLATLQASGDLPPDVTVLPGLAGSGTDEGLAMLEIVHDLAPDAKLYFATCSASQTSMAESIRALANAGCKVIVDDISWVTEPVLQDGVVAQAIDEVAATGVAYFSSAGNNSHLSSGSSGVWEGDFVPYRTITVTVDGNPVEYQTLDFGGTDLNQITSSTHWQYTLQWADPWGASDSDYDLLLIDTDGTTIVTMSTNTQDGNDNPMESIYPSDDVGKYLCVVKKASAPSRFIYLSSYRGRFSIGTEGRVSGHNSAAGCFAIGAVDVANAAGPGGTFNGTEPIEVFSSDGNRRIFFYADGTPITPGNFLSTGGLVRLKPDFSAADGVSCSTSGFSSFHGTSAAAPHAAAIAALLFSRAPALTRTQLSAALTAGAFDIGAPGVDTITGAGLLDAYTSLQAVQIDGVSSYFTIYNDGTGDLDITSIALDSPADYISLTPVAPFSVSPGASRRIFVTVDPDRVPVGTTDRQLIISSSDTALNPYPDGVFLHIVGPAPPTVTTASLSTITQVSATAGGNVLTAGDASVTARGVCWSTAMTPTIADNVTTTGTGTGTFTSSLTELTPGTTYYLRAYATNSIGTAYGDQLTFTTLAQPSVSIADASRTEGDSGQAGLVFNVTLSAASAQTITVAWSTAEGTAGEGTDYVQASGTAEFLPGSTSRTLTVPVIGDTLAEGDETFLVNLGEPVNATGADLQATGTITDDDTSLVSVDDGETTEGATATVTVTLSTANSRDVVLTWRTVAGTATAGSDYTSVTAGSATITAGDLTTTVAVDTLDDLFVEHTETLTVEITGATHASLDEATGTVRIEDNDEPVVSIAAASSAEGDIGPGAITLTVTLSQTAVETTTVDWSTADGTALAGSDYQAASGTVTFLDGQSARTFTVTLLGDELVEPDETFTIHLSNPVSCELGAASATATILNDDSAWLRLAVSPGSMNENGGFAFCTVTRNTPTTAALVVSLGSSDTTEATVPAGVTIPASSSTATFAVSAVDDDIPDGRQTVTLSASATDYVTGTVALEVLDDELTHLVAYTIRCRRALFDGAVATTTEAGFLLIDLDTDQFALVYADRVERLSDDDVALLGEAAAGNAFTQALAGSQQLPLVSDDAFALTLITGRPHDPLAIGGGEYASLPTILTGLRYAGDPAAANLLVGRYHGRFDQTTTTGLNTGRLLYDDAIDQLQGSLAASADASPAVVATALTTHPLVYRTRASLRTSGDGLVSASTRSGYLVAAGDQFAHLTYWIDRDGRHYRLDDWAANSATAAYVADGGSDQVQVYAVQPPGLVATTGELARLEILAGHQTANVTIGTNPRLRDTVAQRLSGRVLIVDGASATGDYVLTAGPWTASLDLTWTHTANNEGLDLNGMLDALTLDLRGRGYTAEAP